MEEIILSAELRQGIGRGKVKSLRQNKYVPAVVYKEGKESQSIQVPSGEFIKLVHHYRIENAIISLNIKNDLKKTPRLCLVKEIQYHPVHGDVLHVDFNEISLTKTIKLKVPVAVKGEAPGVKQDGGSLERILWEIEIECLPTEIPSEIEVDVSSLKIGDAVHIKDIKFSSSVKVIDEQDAIVLHVVAPMKEEVAAEAVEGEEKKEPEVIKEKKEVPAEGAAEDGKEKK